MITNGAPGDRSLDKQAAPCFPMAPMAKALIIVESPAKARTISSYLGADYEVESSIGHIRDLPSSAAEIPAKYKKEPWSRLGVDVDNDFKPLYVIPHGKKKQVDKLKRRLKKASELLLATDEDREGEAIAWHLVEVLEPEAARSGGMVFHEITRPAIERRARRARATSTSTSSTPRRLAGSSTGWSATRSRRCCGASCGPSCPPAGCSRWRRGWSSSARRRGCASSRRASAGLEAELDTGRSGERSFRARLAELAGKKVATARTSTPRPARSRTPPCWCSTSRPPPPCGPRSRVRPSGSLRSPRSPSPAGPTRPS